LDQAFFLPFFSFALSSIITQFGVNQEANFSNPQKRKISETKKQRGQQGGGEETEPLSSLPKKKIEALKIKNKK